MGKININFWGQKIENTPSTDSPVYAFNLLPPKWNVGHVLQCDGAQELILVLYRLCAKLTSCFLNSYRDIENF